MRRTAFKPKMPDRAPKRDRTGEFANFTSQPRPAASSTLTLAEVFAELAPRAQAPTLLKTPGRKRQAIRESARGEECLVRIPGVCCGGTEHTIWSHAPLGAAGKGRGIKALDLCGAYSCTACDAALDQAQRPAGMTREQVLLDWFHGHMRSLVRLSQKGLL